MSAKTNDFKLGLFVVGAVGILIAILFAFGATRLFQRSLKLETYVTTTVEGLKEGAPVLLRGVPVGRVTGINFSWNIYHVREPRYVVVEFDVDRSVSLAPREKDFARLVQEEVGNGLRARVKSQGLAGAVILSLEYVQNPGDYPPLRAPWKPRRAYIPSAPGQMSEIMNAMNSTMANVKAIDFEKIGTAVRHDLDAAARLLDRLDQTDFTGIASNVNTRVTEIGAIGANIDGLVTELRQLSGRLQRFAGPAGLEHGENLPTIASNLNQVLGEMQAGIRKLDSKVANLDLGALNQTLENARRASANLDQASRQLREYPSGVLFGRPPPPAKSVEAPGKR